MYILRSERKKDYTAPVSIEWNNDHILFRMQQNPKCPQTGEIYTLANFKCTPDNERLMVCNQTNLDPNVRQIVNPYHLRKVSQRTQNKTLADLKEYGTKESISKRNLLDA